MTVVGGRAREGIRLLRGSSVVGQFHWDRLVWVLGLGTERTEGLVCLLGCYLVAAILFPYFFCGGEMTTAMYIALCSVLCMESGEHWRKRTRGGGG